MAQNNGHIFEQEFKNSIPFQVYCKRLKSGGMNYKNVNNEGDFLLYSSPNLFLFELKSHKGKSIPFDKLRDNQVNKLYEYTNIKGVICGFIFNFRDIEETYYISAVDIFNYMRDSDRKSFPVDWCREVGIKILQQKKRTRYTYNLDLLLYRLMEEENA